MAGIAAYNEEKHIERVVSQTRKYVDKVIVVDDGSIDNTALIADCVGAEVISHDRNRGMGAAEQTIMEHARKLMKAGDILITLDGDEQHFPVDIPVLLKKLEAGYDVVNGTRMHDGTAKPTLYKRLLILASTWTGWLLSGYRLTDSQSGMKAYRGWVVQRLNFLSKDYAWNSESYIHLRKMGARLGEVPIHTVWTAPSPVHPKHALLYGVKVLGRLFLIKVGML